MKALKIDIFALCFIIFIAILSILGVRGVFYSVGKLGKNFGLVIFGNTAHGKISGHYSNYSSSNKGPTKMYTSIIEYKDTSGKLHKLISDYSSSVPDNNDEIMVYYDNKKPYKAIHADFLAIFFWPFLILCFSVLALFISISFGKPIFTDARNIIIKFTKKFKL